MNRVVAVLADLGYYVAGALTLLLAIVASGHAILYKRDSRAAVSWVGLIWLVPVLGAVLYVMLGVNRIRRRASTVRGEARRLSGAFTVLGGEGAVLGDALGAEHRHLETLAGLADRVCRRPLTAGNAVTPLVNGEAAYPAMLAAIDAARRSVALSAFIFDDDPAGRTFVDALARAAHRGVETRVLIDGVGARFSWPPVTGLLRRRRIRVARFIPTIAPWRAPFWNLRNHRKLLIVDGAVGFTGGMNIRRDHVVAGNARRPVQDLHFRVEGPVVQHLMEVFAEDWAFTTQEFLGGGAWFPAAASAGSVVARGIADGPDEDFEKLRWVIQGAIGVAAESIRVMTPYFLPDATLTAMLNVAALRGVRVEILLPERNNHPLADWASQALLWQFVKNACTVCYTPPPFDHTKLMLVDEAWALIGSANWDPRSLRLNFEFNVECYDRALGAQLGRFMDEKRASGRVVTPAELDAMALPRRLRNGLARLASPYL
jgi:cardiolipin synthase